jgi:carboxymethylenebutenolidase
MIGSRWLVGLCCLGAAFGQEYVTKRLASSPRHHEWVTLETGGRKLESFVVYPEISGKATVVILIHENQGLTDWARGMADQVAEAGYIAIAPDLLSGMGPDGGRTSSFEQGKANEGISKLKPDQVTADLNSVASWALHLPAGNGKVVVAGFCWGGGQTFRFATNRPDLSAAFVFYGSAPESSEDLAKIKAPVYGFYGGNDARIGATVPKTTATMKELNKKYEPVSYEGAGHGFMRAGEGPDAKPENKAAHDQAWKRWMEVLKEIH